LSSGLFSGKAAETLPSLAQEYAITVFDEEAGLSHFALASLAQTPDGRLWYSAFVALGRFDGTRFEDLGAQLSPLLAKTTPRTVMADRRGRLWVGAEGRILCLETNHWRVFAAPEGVPAGLFRNLAEDAQGRLWAASGTNLIRWLASASRGCRRLRDPLRLCMVWPPAGAGPSGVAAISILAGSMRGAG